jgi:hypothetical protein
MKTNITLLRRTCREVAALLIAREDRSLSLPDRLAMRLHLAVCKTCPKFENQVLTLRAAMGRWRHYTGEAEQAAAANTQKQPTH